MGAPVRVAAAMLLLLAAAGSAAAQGSAHSATLSGVIQDGNGQPLGGATVLLQAAPTADTPLAAAEWADVGTTRTMTNGAFAFRVSPAVTTRYRAVFALWESTEDRFVRRDVYELEVWAADAQSARRLAQQEIRGVAGYEPSWRIRQVARIDGGGARGRGGSH